MLYVIQMQCLIAGGTVGYLYWINSGFIVKPENIFTFLINNNPVHSVAGEVSYVETPKQKRLANVKVIVSFTMADRHRRTIYATTLIRIKGLLLPWGEDIVKGGLQVIYENKIS